MTRMASGFWSRRTGSRSVLRKSRKTGIVVPVGTVYVAGQAKSAMPGGGAAQGDWDGYIEAFATDAMWAGLVKTEPDLARVPAHGLHRLASITKHLSS